jgi:transcriptional regulator with XRE-family HTH domain
MRHLRRERGLTQATLARRAELNLRFVQRIESAKTDLSLATLVSIALALHVEPADLLQEPPFHDGADGGA